MTEQSTDGGEMEERPHGDHWEDRKQVDVGAWFSILRMQWWKIGGFSLAVGIVTLLLMFLKPNIYQATAVISPEVDQKKPNIALGALASFGVDLTGTSSFADLEMLFNSKDLTVRVFRKYNLWPIVYPDQFDPATGKKKVSWVDKFIEDEKERTPPGDWDAIRAAKSSLKVNSNKKSGTITISFESRSAPWSATIVRYYLEEGKSRLQEEALDRAIKNKKFIEAQIGRTVDALTRDRLYSLYGQEVEHEMMARNREQFGFRVIDIPRVPDRKFRPSRAKAAILATFMAFFFGWGIAVIRSKHHGSA